MSQRARLSQAGFSLMELMIVLLCLSILIAMLTPNYWTYIQRAKQVDTLNTITTIGKACMQWVLASDGAASVGDPVDLFDYPIQLTHDEVEALLSPRFIAYVPATDRWGNPLEFYFSGDVGGPRVFCVRSPGQDGIFDGSTYEIGPFTNTDYSQDLVWADGTLVRWPE